MNVQPPDHSPAPWTLADSMYGIGNCLIDRDGRVIGAHLPIGNGPLIAQAPAMAELLRELVAGEQPEKLRAREGHPNPSYINVHASLNSRRGPRGMSFDGSP